MNDSKSARELYEILGKISIIVYTILLFGFLIFSWTDLIRVPPPRIAIDNVQQRNNGVTDRMETASTSAITEQACCERNPNDEERNLRDLTAQEGMQGAAVGLFGITVFQGIVAFIGLALLWRTLVATRANAGAAIDAADAANITAKATENSDRAYLMVEFDCRFGHGGKYGSEDRFPPEVKFGNFIVTPKITNYGKSPALEVKTEIIRDQWGRSRDSFDAFHVPNHGRSTKTIDIVGSAKPVNLQTFPINNTGWYFGPRFSGDEELTDIYCQFYFNVTYKDVYRRDRHIKGVTSVIPISSTSFGENFRNCIVGDKPTEFDPYGKIEYISDEMYNHIMRSVDDFDIETTIFSQDES